MLVASTDPAASLGDAFATRLAASPRRITLKKGRLWAVEINATVSLQRWLDERRALLEKIAVEGTWLDQDDVTKLLRLSLPGIDELAALLEIRRLAGLGRYDLIVVDTAPTGHTLRMLSMPRTLGGLADVFEAMRQKQRVMQEALRGGWHPSAEDGLIDDLAATAEDLSALLRNPARTRLSWVTLGEPMAIEETIDAIQALRESGIAVQSVIANRLTPPLSEPCRHCAARRTLEHKALRGLPPVDELVGVTARVTEPTGVPALTGLGAELRQGSLRLDRAPRTRGWAASLNGARCAPADLIPESARLVLLGGKGGVGKTTCAAALAISAADRWKQRRVLLMSADPAHSLADALASAVSDTPSTVAAGPSNLAAREMDAGRILAGFQVRYIETIDRMFDRLAGDGSFDVAHDRSVMRGLIELAPPGLDELTAVLEITDAMSGDAPQWDLVVMDTAPTGHALRLLEMPSLIQAWVRALMAILLKYQAVARVGAFAEILLKLSRGIGRLRDLLARPEETIFIAVTRAAALPRLETVRLVRRLAQLQIHVPAIVINAVGHGDCRRCARIGAGERREIAAISKALAAEGRRMVVTGAQLPPPSGSTSLKRWGKDAWRAAPGYHRIP
ncbi:MAG: ArsA family ATPase [Acidobacteria bacterium]|nr:ArsA family ATPase [Acidobacteriota bacterium]